MNEERISSFTLGDALYADCLDHFLHGEKEDFEEAERLYLRFTERHEHEASSD